MHDAGDAAFEPLVSAAPAGARADEHRVAVHRGPEAGAADEEVVVAPAPAGLDEKRVAVRMHVDGAGAEAVLRGERRERVGRRSFARRRVELAGDRRDRGIVVARWAAVPTRATAGPPSRRRLLGRAARLAAPALPRRLRLRASAPRRLPAGLGASRWTGAADGSAPGAGQSLSVR